MKERYETYRLYLLPARQEMVQMVTSYFQKNRAFFAQFDSDREESFFTEEFQRQLLLQDEENRENATGFRFYIVRKECPDAIIGMISLNNVIWGCFCSCFLGYKLDKDWLRQGFMSEAVKECVRIGFEELGLHRIEANIMPHNAASLGVARKCGFVEEGLGRKYLKINGVWEDHLHMVRLNEPDVMG